MSRNGSADIEQRKVDGASDRRVGAKTVDPDNHGRLHADLAGDRSACEYEVPALKEVVTAWSKPYCGCAIARNAVSTIGSIAAVILPITAAISASLTVSGVRWALCS